MSSISRSFAVVCPVYPWISFFSWAMRSQAVPFSCHGLPAKLKKFLLSDYRARNRGGRILRLRCQHRRKVNTISAISFCFETRLLGDKFI